MVQKSTCSRRFAVLSMRNEMVSRIKEGSMIHWGHINLHGEFDFKRQGANDTPFDMRKILSLQLAGA